MGVSIHRAGRWQEQVEALAARLADEPPGPFEQIEVLVSSRGAGRMLSQALASLLPAGVCAGISFPTVAEWVRSTASRHGLLEDLGAWWSARAVVVAARVLDELAEEHPVLAAHLNANGSPARRQLLAQRSMMLFRRYVDHTPQMVSAWLEDHDVDAEGSELRAHLRWQPALLRGVAERLEVDPVEVWAGLADAVAGEGNPPLVFCLPEVPLAQRGVLAAAAAAEEMDVWQVTGSGFEDWTRSLDPASPPEAAPRSPEVHVHGSHGPSRQVEVLRDELARRFQEDQTLEPREVLVVCEDPARWRPHLLSAFTPVPEDPEAHPGRGLRLQTGSVVDRNLVVEVVRRCLRLAESRATATDLVELMLLSPVAHRWRLGPHRREDLVGLVSEAGIRWGLDQHHRTRLGVPGISQNTWVRGVDRLLAGIALAPGSDAPVAVTGVASVSTSDLDLVGTVAEILSRLRRFNLAAAEAAPVSEWVGRVRQLLADVVGCSFTDEWMLLQTNTALSDLADQLAEQPEPLGRSEFTRLLESVTREFAPRPTVGNGALQVVGIGDLAHVDFRLVCLLGIGDRHGRGDVDSVPLGDVPDSRRLRLARLLAHARAADELLVIGQTRDPLTNQEVAGATTVSWLLRELGAPGTERVQHSLLSHAESNFTDGQSFDQHALAAALALRATAEGTAAPHVLRRRAALELPHSDDQHEISLRDLATFLKDPAKDFLRSAAGVRLFSSPELDDALPLVLNGLDEWSIRDRLFTSFRQGLNPAQAEALEVERELLPPGHIGRRLLAEQLEAAVELWRRVWADWSAPAADHRIELAFGNVVLADTVRTRGGRIIGIAPGSGAKTQVEPWLQLLALAASGTSTDGVVHGIKRSYGSLQRETHQLAPQSREAATEVLGHITRAWSQSRSRLVPLPLEPALEFARELADGKHVPKDWETTSPPWESKWNRVPSHWRLFYSEVPADLFRDPATTRDPVPPEHHGEDSAFAAWAAAIYLPMFQGGE